jgi:hypothetical protein
MVAVSRERLETLGPAERIVNTVAQYLDHLIHNRPGYITPDPSANIGVKWQPCSWKLEDGQKNVYREEQVPAGRGKMRKIRTRIGVLGDDGAIRDGNRVIGQYRTSGFFPEVAIWMYRQVAEVFKSDNEFVAHWASWAWAREHRDLKVVLAAFLLVQNRTGEPVRGADGTVEFLDDDFRTVGEAMCLLRGKTGFDAKLLLRVGKFLELPGIAAINRELGFGRSARSAFLGRYPKAVEKWLRNRELNPKVLERDVKSGWRTTIMELARRIGFKPLTARFFEVLRWKQVQAADGRRALAIGAAVKVAESWVGLSETEIGNRIEKDKPNWKRIVGMLPAPLPADVKTPANGYRGGLTCAITVAAIENGCMSNADMIIHYALLEELDVLKVPSVAAKVAVARATATNQRAANVALRVRKTENVAALQEAADKATARVMEEATRGMRVYWVIDKSGSMHTAIAKAKEYLTRFLGGFPTDRTHISVFDSIGVEVTLKAPTSAGVENAFSRFNAGGSTCYAAGVEVLLRTHKPGPDEDALFLFVGDEGEYNNQRMIEVFRTYGVTPGAFGLLKVPGENGEIVRWTAQQMGIPCLTIEESLFSDPYAITRTLRNLIASTPVSMARRATPAAQPRKTLIQEILDTPLLQL